jgi:multidrug efflux pump subunit AcrA (membrane-fusion protein)
VEIEYLEYMSFEQPADPQLIEQTRRQIRSLVAEIAQLSEADVAPEAFYGDFLPRVVSALAASGGAVWALNPDGQMALQYQINIQETRLRENEEHNAQHSRLLYKALSGGEGMLVPPHSGPGGADSLDTDAPAANPTEFLLILGLLKTDLETIGLVEIFQRPDAAPESQQGYLRFLLQMCKLAGDFLKSHQLRHFSHRQTLWTQLEDFTRGVHASLDPREAAYTIANEGRRLIECDRVSVAIRKGQKCTIEAVSGQDVFDKRSNTVRLLGKLATAVVRSGDPVWYTGDTRDLPPQVEDAVQEYVDEAHSKTVAVLPLRRPAPAEEDDPKKRTEPEPPIGALIVEQIEDSRVSTSLVQRAEVVGRHSSLALANALEHQNLFLMPVWRALGKTRWVVQGRTLPKTLSIAGVVLALIVLMAVLPWQFTQESKGTLEPIQRQAVFAGIDGVVHERLVEHGASVSKNQRLVKLRSTELDLQIAEVGGQRAANAQDLEGVKRLLDERPKPEDRIRLQGELARLTEKQITLEAQWKICQAKQVELDVRSPLDGTVVTWDLQLRLPLGRPVQKGQELLRVGNPRGPLQLELQMPENRIGHVAEAQQEKYAEARDKLRELLREDTRGKLGDAASEEELDKAVVAALGEVPDEKLHDRLVAIYRQRGLPEDELDDQLTVSYVLADESGVRRYGKVTEIARSAEVHGEEGNTVLVKVAIDRSDLPDPRPGVGVTAKVYCGYRPVGYVLLQDVIAFIQSRILFKFF